MSSQELSKLFKIFTPLSKQMFTIMDNDGKVTNSEWMPIISEEKLVSTYKNLLFARIADLKIVTFQRQGRIFTYPPNYGQEAIAGAAGAVIREQDWFVPAFREMSGMLAKGVKLNDLFLYFMGFEEGMEMKDANHVLPMCVPIASQYVHAAGIGYAVKAKKRDEVVYVFCGDGGTSEGDFHEGLNFAGVWKVPVIFVIQNNQYAISTPTHLQTASESLAIKAIAYGVKGICVDGNDFLAMYKVFEEASEICRKGMGPVLIEAITYRRGAHTTSDDPSLYRTIEEEKSWEIKDPLKRLQLYLIDQGLWNLKQDQEISTEYDTEIERLFAEAEKHGDYPLENVFRYHYAEMPEDFRQQMRYQEEFIRWKAERIRKGEVEETKLYSDRG